MPSGTATGTLSAVPHAPAVTCAASERYRGDDAWLVGEQIERRAVTDAITLDKREVEQVFRQFGSSDERARAIVDRNDGAFTPQMSAQLATVLLCGSLGQHIKDDVRWLAGGCGGSEPVLPHIPRGNQRALHKLFVSIRSRPPNERELFLRATAWELARIDEELVHRFVKNIGAALLAGVVPSLDGLSPGEMVDALIDQDRVLAYLDQHRSQPSVTTYAPNRRTKALVAKAQVLLQNADALPASASPKRRRRAYAVARDGFAAAVAECPAAIRDPKVQAWMTRRARALFVYFAFEEVRSGPTDTKAWSLARTALSRLPLLARFATTAPGEAEPALLVRLTAQLGFDPTGPLTDEQRTALIVALANATLDDGAADGLIEAMLPPRVGARETPVHVVFAPGVIPIGGVFDKAFVRLEEELDCAVTTAATGLFESDGDNAIEIARAVDAALAADPRARIVLMGYSQGVPNILRYLDDLGRGGDEARSKRANVCAVSSLYGAHNGSLAADEFLPMVRSVTSRLPMADRLEVGLSSFERVGRFVGGGVNSLKRKTRERWWQIADVPDNIAFLSLAAHPHSDDALPRVLVANHHNLERLAARRGLPPDNDTQVLACDAPLGSEASAIGRSIRRANVTTDVRGHHWNPLSPAHVPIDADQVYAFPKAPQVMTHVALLGDLGWFG